MRHTVIGIFEYGVDAQMAAQQLISNGLSSDQIDITIGHAGDKPGHVSDTAHLEEKRRRTGSFFGSLFSDKKESDKYSRVAERSAFVTVHAQSEEEAERAAELLDKSGAVDVDELEEKLQRSTGTDRTDLREQATAEPTGTIPVVEEHVHIRKREEETGGVRLRSRILQRPVEEHLRLREEHLNIERKPVDRPVTEKDATHFQKGEIEIVEHAEVPVVKKEQRVVEEIRLTKETTEHEETIRETERKQQIDTERIPGERDLRDPNRPENRDNR